MDNSDVETLREEEAEEMTAECPPSVSITIPAPPAPNEASCYARLSPTCSEVTYDEDDRESISSAPSISIPPSIETSPTLTTRSQGSRSSFDGFHNGSTALVDRELVAQACASLARTAAEIQALDLSTNTKKPRRALKSLRALSELTNLVQLDVSGNAVERLDGLQVLIQLQSLALARNNLKSLGAPLFALKNLTSLDLSGNFIVHLPRAFSDLTSIEVLNLSGNSLATLREVDVLAPLANLLACNLAANPFCRLPTYKDYVICKIRSLERLDDMPISTVARDRAAKRFGTAMFSQDACLREAGRVHESEQNRLLMAQSALEAENLRLKGELQVKSKLLQNKSRAWSSATEQLLQLQQEVAMLNLDRRRSMSLSDDQPNSAEKIAMAIAGRSRACDQQRPQSALPRISSPKRSIEKRSGSFSETDQHRNWSQEGENEAGGPSETSRQTTSPTRSPESKHAQESTTSPTKTKESTHLQQGTTSLSKPQGFKHTKESTTSPAKPHGPNNTQQSNTDSSEADTDQILIKRNRDKVFVDASCSPVRVVPTPITTQIADVQEEGNGVAAMEQEAAVPKNEDLSAQPRNSEMEVSIPLTRTSTPRAAKLSTSLKQRNRAHSIEQVRRALAEQTQLSDDLSASLDFGLQEDEPGGMNELNPSRAGRFPMFEDDSACPAYEDTHYQLLQQRSASTSNLSSHRSHSIADNAPAAPSPGSHSLPPSPATSPSRLRLWFRKQNELRLLTPPPSPPRQVPSPYKPPQDASLASPLAPFVDKEVLSRQIQSLQSCKQSLLTEIKNEEHILHVLKRESLQYEDQIDRLSVNIQACLDGDPSAIKLSFASSGSPRRGSKKRQEETGRAQLEILRNKLRFAEDKEKEIEMTMVRMTKRVLQADLNPSERANAREKFSPIQSPMSSDTPFDKEIFALTHRLQLVIVEKEEIHMQMSQLMASLRNQNGSDAGIPGLGFDEDDGDSMNDKIDSRKHAQSLAKSRQMMDDLRTRHREVTDRIHIKEQRISTLLEELKEVELELEHISRLNVSSALSPLFQRERAASMEFLHNMRSRLKREGIIKTGSETDASGTWSHSEAGDDIQDSQPFTEFVNEQEGNIMNPQTSILNPESNELFSPDEIEKIKADIYEKMSKQLTASTGGVNKENSTGIYREDLHAAIAAALETRLQLSLGSHDPGKSEDICEFNQVGASEYNNHQNEQLVVNEDLPDVVVASDEICCDEFDEFAQVEAYYAKKYVLAKDRAAMFLKSCSEDEANVNSTQLTGAQRILKMCERLDVAEAQYKVDPVSKIELDQLGKHRSSLKISLLTARDLPTTHLRTKNLDPYVSFEVVYPPHAVPPPLSDREEKVFRSRTKKKSIYPVWDEDFDFSPILSLNGYLHVRVLNDRRLSREQLVGETRIPLHTLMHQRRIVEWFSLGLAIPPASTGSVPPGRIVTKVCGGAIRLQLHLTFSSVERYKRVVDELVTKYVLEHNQLPEFIDSVEDCDKRAEPGFGSEQPEHNGAEIMTVMHDEVGSVSFERLRQSDVEPHFPLEIETSLPVYNGWQRDTPAQQVHFHEDTKDQVSASRTSTHEISTRLSAERAKALWEPKTSDRPVDSGKTVAMIDRKPATGSSSNGSGRKKQQRTASSGALHRAQSKLRRSASLHQHMSLRRKRVEAPECFDEYSPYHPGFNNTDLLENGNNELLRNDHLRSGSFVSRGADANRKTDLRIFKSPSVSRRPPSTGFPERYIGLDNQTCERLKRIIGRMDGS